ncbi:hypothetical protein DICPUDRAFT_159700 [Dictyostelium purpureum]|uniref:Rho-GAP domain-containing protein n=1 Tax=Dictyostelium purpureum TaxID=5786 RepID=F1A4S2_DICPU|nr:uncharacterized protein DICPUDRAFT_159700 [Dictyostelium purpureum]EGC28806.1 hypothetical protein DICPUDRAFT_159700 [Dictyostelium purpureum]|eukprot:XP_003294668.1 hypothetical protein DICPUDRAFT_159700 [Dictyostelium purpureum]
MEDKSFKRGSFKLPAGVNIENMSYEDINNNNSNSVNSGSSSSNGATGTTPTRKVTFGSRVRVQQPPPVDEKIIDPLTTNNNNRNNVDEFDLDPVPISRPRANRAATMIPSHMITENKPIRPIREFKIGNDRSQRQSIESNTGSENNSNNNNNNDEDDEEFSGSPAPSWSSVMSLSKKNTINSKKKSGLITDYLNQEELSSVQTTSTPSTTTTDTNEDGSSRRGTLRKAIVIGTHQPSQIDDIDETASRISSLDLANVSRPKPQYHTIDPASIPQWKKNNEDLLQTMEKAPIVEQNPPQTSGGVGGLFNSILKASPLSRQQNNPNNSTGGQRLTKAEVEYTEYLNKARNQQFPDIEQLNFIYPAGKDNLGRTIIVIVASHLPVKETDMERVLLYTISIMDPVVEEEYVLVYVHTNMNNSNKPSFAWMKKVYTIFNRKYKKNLKGLYIVHPTTWIKFTLGLFKHFLSSKFWRKLTYIDDLSDLFRVFSREQLSLPTSIMMYRPAGRKSQPIFGAPLEDVINRPDNPGEIPVLFEKGISYLTRRGLKVEGLFRLSGANSQIKSLRQGFDQGEDVDLEDVEDVHTVAGLLKLYLRELPSPLFPFDTYSSFIEISKGDQTKPQKVESLKLLLSLLPPANKALAKHLFKFLAKVIENAGVNKMNSVNLSIVFAPNLLKEKDGNVLNVVADAQYSQLRVLDDQIAGHTEEDGGSENIPPFLKSEEGFVFKPVPSTRGGRELDFYKSIDSVDQSLLEFLPKFIRVEMVKDIPYMGLEDLTYGYKSDFVNVADIKMGTQTYDSSASAEKIRLEQEKSSKTTTKPLGIRFCGAKVVGPSGKKEKLSKVWGKKLSPNNIFEEGIKKFFTNPERSESENQLIVKEFLNLLNKLLQVFKNNEKLAFYSSSLLFVYGPIDHDSVNSKPTTSITPLGNTGLGVTMKMIDFAHVDELTPPQKDDGYIFGLNNLIGFLNKLVK